MGDTGSLSLGATLAVISILTKHEISLIVVAGVFVIETISCIIQMIAGRYFGKKSFNGSTSSPFRKARMA